MNRGLVTLLTDFGTGDSYVAEVVASVLHYAPDARLVHISHQVSQGDVGSAHYLLARSWHRFPEGTVHLTVVDPGVGTGRRALALEHHGHRFVGPDNGVFSSVLDGSLVIGLPVGSEASATFHGRDVFGPAAGKLAHGVPLEALGGRVEPTVRLSAPRLERKEKLIVGEVVYVDGFGNLITNVPSSDLSRLVSVSVRGTRLPELSRTFADVADGQPLAYLGSGGTLEIAVANGSARRELGAGMGDVVEVELED